MNTVSTLRDGIASVALFFNDLDTPYRVGRTDIHCLVHILSRVKDFRSQGKSVYKLENLLAICFILAMMGKLQSFYYVAEYVRIHEDHFVELGLVEPGKLPSHDTFRRIFMHLDANGFRDVFLDRIKEFLERLAKLDQRTKGKKKILSGDGKTFNGSGRGNLENLNVFNMYSASSVICLSSVPLTDKESEIPEFQRMLPKFDLRNTVVTADALHCQRVTSQIIVNHRGGYVFKVKGNQESLLSEIKQRFEHNSGKIGKTTTLSHNKCEYEILVLKKGYVGCQWPGQKSYVKMISHKRKGQRDYDPLPQYFISSESNPQLIAEAIDNRWEIEDGLHHFKDTFLKEDECSFADKNAVKVMATLNNIVYSIYRIACAVLGHTRMTETKIRFENDPLGLISTVIPLLKKKNLTALIRANMRGVKPAK